MISTSSSISSPLVTNSFSEVIMEHTRKFRIGIIASGSRGDIQPYIAIGLHLKDRGHDVTVVTEKRMEFLVREFNLQYGFIEGDPCGLLFQPEAQAPLKSGSLWSIMQQTKEWEKKWDKLDIYNSYYTALKECEVIISSGLTLTASYCVAEAIRAAWIPMILGPTLPTSEFPVWILESIIFCSCLNKWSYQLLFSLLWMSEKDLINKWRKQTLGLEEITYSRGIGDVIDKVNPPIIIAYSQYLCPHQRIPGDYPLNAHLNGFVFVPKSPEDQISNSLKSFITSSDPRPIVYLGLGSMPVPDVNELIQFAIDICKLCNARGLLVAGFSQLFNDDGTEVSNSSLRSAVADGTMLLMKAVPHDWVFPRVHCILHHGGIGTTAAALRSGVPQVICPVMLDQPHNAKSVVQFNCSPGYVPYNSYITAAKVAQLVKQVLPTTGSTNRFIAAAKELGSLIEKESSMSLDMYANIIESYASTKLSS